MKILVTGSNGFIGKTFVHVLSLHNDVSTLSRSNSDYNFDLSKQVPLFRTKFDLVIHAAGKAHSNPKTIQEKQSFIDNNVCATKNLLIGLEKSFLPKYILFISTVNVYGRTSGNLIDENTQPNPIDIYGITKLNCEKMIMDWSSTNKVLCTIFRLPLVVGLNPKGNLKSMIIAIQKGYFFNIDKGSARRSMVLITDLIKYIPLAIDIGGIYNLTDGKHPSYFEISNLVSRLSNARPPKNIPKIFALLLARIGNLLGNKFPFNYSMYIKLISTLTFCDQKARNQFGWHPNSVLTNLTLK
jgi:nucleoside-diphosphate-sugar epimerase